MRFYYLVIKRLCAISALFFSGLAIAQQVTLTFDDHDFNGAASTRLGNGPYVTDGYVFTSEGGVTLWVLTPTFDDNNSPPSNTPYFTSEYSSGETKFKMASSSAGNFSLCSFDAAPIYSSDAAQLVVAGTTAQGERSVSFSLPSDPGASPWNTFVMPLWEEVTELSFTYGDDFIGLENFVLNDPSCVDSDGDGVNDASDAFPNDASESADSDGDGVGDNKDAYPNDPTRSVMPVPVMSALGLLLLAGLISLLGLRRLRV